MSSKKVRVLTSLLILCAVYVALLPLLLDTYSGIRQRIVIRSYAEELDMVSAETRERMKDEACRYNENLYQEYRTKLFFYTKDGTEDMVYQNLLSEAENDTVMGVIDIPKISVTLPLVHGTGSESLGNAAGHMYGTSLPIGGLNTHAVIAAHTGLSTARLFTDLNQMEVGDCFSINVLDEVLIYEVDAINIVLPEEEYHYLQIEDGKDLVTLYTCTPYGINDHRLLVRGKRVEGMAMAESMGDDHIVNGVEALQEELSLLILVKFLIFLFTPLFFWILYIIYLCYTSSWISGDRKPRLD